MSRSPFYPHETERASERLLVSLDFAATLIFLGVLAVVAAWLSSCKPVPPLPPEPSHTVTLGDASFSGDCIEVSWDVLDALNCPESLHDKALYRTKAEAIGYDFDFCAVAACHDTDCLHAHAVRCEEP